MIRIERNWGQNPEEPVPPFAAEVFAKHLGEELEQLNDPRIQEIKLGLPENIALLLSQHIERSEAEALLKAEQVQAPEGVEPVSSDRIKIPTIDRYLVVMSFADGAKAYKFEGTE